MKITSVNNELVKETAKLLQRKYRKTHFLLEGIKCIEEAIESDEYNQEEKNYCKNKLKCYQIELKRQIEILQKELEEEEKKKEFETNKEMKEISFNRVSFKNDDFITETLEKIEREEKE